MSSNGRPEKYRVLFLCKGNSGRSILGEYFLRRIDPFEEMTEASGSPRRADSRNEAAIACGELVGKAV